MPAVCRLGDGGSGHDVFAPRVNDTASSDVFINGKGAHRKGDHWVPHSYGSTHDGVLSSGSSTVFVNGKALGRIGDSISCGSVVVEGSGNVFSG